MGADTLTNLKELNSFLRKHKTVDFRTTDLLNTTSLDSFTWPSDESQMHALLGQVKSYQRLLRVLPTSDALLTGDLAKNLMKMGINSALQITQIGKNEFISNTHKIFSQCPEMATQVYKRALVSRKLVTTKYIRQRQNLEPHARTVGLNL
jgi:hypothetical protein